MNKIEPSFGNAELVDELTVARSSVYSSPQTKFKDPDNLKISALSPLLFLMVMFIAYGPLASDGIKSLLTLNQASILQAVMSVFIVGGMIWWATCDSKRYAYKLTGC